MTTDQPRLVVVSQLPPPAHGSTIMTGHLLDSLRSLGYSVDLVQRSFSRSVDEVGRPGLRKIVAAPALLARLVGAVRAAGAPRCIFFLTNRPGSFLVDLVLLAALRAMRVPVIAYLHTSGYAALADRGPFWRAGVRWALRSAERIVTLGPRLVPDIASFVRSERISTVANTAGVPAPAEREVAAEPRVLYLSNLLPEKGVDVFVRTAARLADRLGPAVRFDIAGAGDPAAVRRVRDAVEVAGLADRCTVHGAVGPEEKWRLLTEAAVLLFPSQYPLEAQPLTIVEALAAGTPVVAFDVGGVGDVVSTETGALVPAGNEDAATEAVAAILAEPQLRAAMGEAARARYRSAHAPDAYTAAWGSLLGAGASAAPGEEHGFAGSFHALRRLVALDWRANPRDPKSRAVLLAFRLAQFAMGTPAELRFRAVLPVLLYRAWTEGVLGIELRPKTRVGGGLTIYHGYGLVVNDHTVIGSGVVLRNGVTIGHRVDGGPCPVLGDGVQLGAGAIVLGGVRIGDGASIGAGAVVLADVPARGVAVGNPARVLPGRT
ncbi:MAG TPA: glycosyltransferase [Amnibacterium sp.]